MGEYAEAALWAERNGMEFSDMGPEEWMDFYDEIEPPSAGYIHAEASSFLSCLDEHKGDDGTPSRVQIIQGLLPDIAEDDAKALIRGLEAIAALPSPYDIED